MFTTERYLLSFSCSRTPTRAEQTCFKLGTYQYNNVGLRAEKYYKYYASHGAMAGVALSRVNNLVSVRLSFLSLQSTLSAHHEQELHCWVAEPRG